jgi:plastocyanin
MRIARECVFSAVVILLVTTASAFAGTIEGRLQSRNSALDLGNAVVWVDDIVGPFPAPGGVAVIDQRSLRFVPHVLAIQVGTTVEFANSDPLAHNVFSISSPKRFNLGLYEKGAVRRVLFDQPGIVKLLCNVHQEMSAFIVVVKNPYFARPAADGSFRIADVPAGKHVLRCWHEGVGERTFEVEVPASGAVKATLAVN